MSPMRTALPVAHKTGSGSGSLSYEDYFLPAMPGNDYMCKLQLYRVFNQRYNIGGDQRVCPGLYLGLNDSDTGTDPGDGRINPSNRVVFSDSESDLLNLHAVTDGFLSWDGGRLVLRLPRELEHISFSEDVNSGELLYSVPPQGPNLRYVVYDFDIENPNLSAVETTIKSKLQPLLADSSHPVRTALNVQITEENNGSTTTRNVDLDSYITSGNAATRIGEIIEGFVDGELSLLVEAGDAIASLADTGEVMIEFHDSCGSYQPGSFSYHDDDSSAGDNVDSTFRPEKLRQPIGNRLNPSYFLWVLASQSNRNGNHVDLKTNLNSAFNPSGPAHPLLYLLDTVPASHNHAELDVTTSTPPRPRNYTVPISNNDGDTGLPLGALSEWHESRNASDPYDTNAAVEWRVYGDGYTDNAGNRVTDGTDADVGKFRSQRKSGTSAGNMPTGYNPDFPPDGTARDVVSHTWNDYGNLINPIAERFDMPCALIVALCCQESGAWRTGERESIVACEPFPRSVRRRANPVAHVAANPWSERDAPVRNPSARNDQQMLNDYHNFVGTGTTNPDPIPIPWNDGTSIAGGTALTWEELAYLHAKFADNVRYTPGVIQIQPTVAVKIIGQIEDYYGDPLFDGIEATVTVGGTNHNLTVQDPSDDLQTIASNWFGVDHGGANSDLSRKHRAFHSLSAGVAKMRRDYNTSVLGWNLITDYDPPTVAAAHNAGAEHRPFNANQWDHIFGLNFHSGAYPENFPQYYNAAVELFNGEWASITGRALPASNPTPTVRFRRSP